MPAGRRKFRASMSVALALGLGFFVLTAVAGVLGVGLLVGYRNTSDLLTQKAELIIEAQKEQTRRYLMAAENQVEFIADRIAEGSIEPDGGDEFTSLLFGAISATPQIIRIQFIDDRDYLYGVERGFDDSEEGAAPIFQRIGFDDDLMALTEGARKEMRPHWGALLWRQEYEQPVMNFQQSVVRDGKTIGVLSAWVSVVELSEFLADQEMRFGANAFILLGRNAVLAHPMMAFGYAGLNRSTPLPKQTSFSDPVVTSMWRQDDTFSIARQFLEGPNTRFVRFANLEYVVLFSEMPGFGPSPLTVATYFEAHDITAEAARLKWAIVFCLGMAVISAAAAAVIGHKISQPVRRLADSAKRIHDLDLDSVGVIEGSFFRELNDAAESYNFMLDGLRWFERYVPKRLVRRLMQFHSGETIQSAHRDVVIMFTDMVSFTGFSEHMTAPATADFLNEHFGALTTIIDRNGGTVDKFIGDAVMAIWGGLEHQDDAADRACRAALEIAGWVHDYNKRQRAEHESAPTVRLRIGLHLGRVVVGNIGSQDRLSYTVVGDTVNVAQRLEEAGKTLGEPRSETNILVSSSVRAALVHPIAFTHLGAHKLRGREELVEIYNLKPPTEKRTVVSITRQGPASV